MKRWSKSNPGLSKALNSQSQQQRREGPATATAQFNFRDQSGFISSSSPSAAAGGGGGGGRRRWSVSSQKYVAVAPRVGAAGVTPAAAPGFQSRSAPTTGGIRADTFGASNGAKQAAASSSLASNSHRSSQGMSHTGGWGGTSGAGRARPSNWRDRFPAETFASSLAKNSDWIVPTPNVDAADDVAPCVTWLPGQRRRNGKLLEEATQNSRKHTGSSNDVQVFELDIPAGDSIVLASDLGPILQGAMEIADVDGDSLCEIVVATLDGELKIFKGVLQHQPVPLSPPKVSLSACRASALADEMESADVLSLTHGDAVTLTCSGLGPLTCVCVGDLMNVGHPVVVCATAEGVFYIFDPWAQKRRAKKSPVPFALPVKVENGGGKLSTPVFSASANQNAFRQPLPNVRDEDVPLLTPLPPLVSHQPSPNGEQSPLDGDSVSAHTLTDSANADAAVCSRARALADVLVSPVVECTMDSCSPLLLHCAKIGVCATTDLYVAEGSSCCLRRYLYQSQQKSGARIGRSQSKPKTQDPEHVAKLLADQLQNASLELQNQLVFPASIASISSSPAGAPPTGGGARLLALVVSLDNFDLAIAVHDEVLRVISPLAVPQACPMLREALELDMVDENSLGNGAAGFHSLGFAVPCLNTSARSPAAAIPLLASCGTAVVVAPLLATRADAEEYRQPAKVVNDDADPASLKHGGGSPPSTPSGGSHGDKARLSPGLSWLDSDDAAQRAEFVALLKTQNLPIPRNETQFHAARIYIDSKKRSEYDTEQWMDYFNLMEERRASNADKEDASNRAAAFQAWVAELQSVVALPPSTLDAAKSDEGMESPALNHSESSKVVPLPRTLFEIQLGTGDLCSGGSVSWDSDSEPESHTAVGTVVQRESRSTKRKFASAACSLDGQLSFLHLTTARPPAPAERSSANGYSHVQSVIVCTADLGSPVNTCVVGNCAGFAPPRTNQPTTVSRESSQSHLSTPPFIPTAEFADAATSGVVELPSSSKIAPTPSTAGTVADAPTITFDNHFGVDGVPEVQFSSVADSDVSPRTPSSSSSDTKSQPARLTEGAPPSPKHDQEPVFPTQRRARLGNVPCCVFTDPYGQLVAQVGFAVESGLHQVRELNESSQDTDSKSQTGGQSALVNALEVEDHGRLMKAAQDATSTLLGFAGRASLPTQCPNGGMQALLEVLLGVDEVALESWADELQSMLETP